MASVIQIAYKAVKMAAGASITLPCNGVAAFLCTTTGTLTVTNGAGVALLTGMAVTAGQRLDLTMYTDQGATIALTTAAGTLLYW